MGEISVERIGQEVDRLRTKYDIGMKEFAAALDVPFETIWRLEQQVDYVPDGKLLIKIVAHLKAIGASDQDLTLLNAEIARLETQPERESGEIGGGLLVVNIVGGLGLWAYYVFDFRYSSEFQQRLIESLWGAPGAMPPSVRFTFAGLCLVHALLAVAGLAVRRVNWLKQWLVWAFLSWAAYWFWFAYQAQVPVRGAVGVVATLLAVGAIASISERGPKKTRSDSEPR